MRNGVIGMIRTNGAELSPITLSPLWNRYKLTVIESSPRP
jgi:hypothetical protein